MPRDWLLTEFLYSFFISIYPILRSGLLTIDLLFQWNYLFTNSNTPKFFSLLNYLLGIKIVRLTAQDYVTLTPHNIPNFL